MASVQFTMFRGRDPKQSKDWLASACACVGECSFHPGAEKLGAGSSGVVYACSFGGRPAAAKVFVEYALHGDKKQPSCSEIQNTLSVRGKRKRVSAATKKSLWYTQLHSMLLEIRYARIAERAEVGPKVFGAAIVMRKNPVVQIGMCLIMERLCPPPVRCPHNKVLQLLENVAACKLFCLDLKRDHIMQTEAGELRMVDFGSEWCVQECPVLQTTHRGDLPPRAVRLSVVRNAMVVVMAIQLALHSLFWVREQNSESGNDEPVAFMFDVLWGMWAEDKHRWHMARRVFCSDKMEPICSTYYKKDGADMFDVLEGMFSGCKNTHDGQLVSVGGATWEPRHLLSNLSGRTPTAVGSSTSSASSTDTAECHDAVSLECY